MKCTLLSNLPYSSLSLNCRGYVIFYHIYYLKKYFLEIHVKKYYIKIFWFCSAYFLFAVVVVENMLLVKQEISQNMGVG